MDRWDTGLVDITGDQGLLAQVNGRHSGAVIDWLNVLRRIPTIRNRDARLAEADQILRSRLNFQGTTMGFSTERSDYCWWLMAGTDVNAVRLLLAQLVWLLHQSTPRRHRSDA